MEQTRALNALAPFLALSKSATSPRAAADLVSQATSAQNTYVFAELLQTPSIQGLREDAQYAGHYKLLQIFAWGTWEDYQGAASSLPPLTDAQSTKLRLLTLLTLAARSPSNLTYPVLQRSLSLDSSFELEQLVTEAIYNNLLTATLDPHQQVVIVSSVAPLRDLAPGSVPAMVVQLEAWAARCEDVLKDLETEMEKIKAQSREKARQESIKAKQVERATEQAEKEGFMKQGPSRGASDFEGEAMDVDETAGNGRGGKKRGKFFGKR